MKFQPPYPNPQTSIEYAQNAAYYAKVSKNYAEKALFASKIGLVVVAVLIFLLTAFSLYLRYGH